MSILDSKHKRILTDAEKKQMVQNLRKFRRYFDSHKPEEEDDAQVLKEYFDFNRFDDESFVGLSL